MNLKTLATTPCSGTDCDLRVVADRVWRGLPVEQREQLMTEGVRNNVGQGMCPACRRKAAEAQVDQNSDLFVEALMIARLNNLVPPLPHDLETVATAYVPPESLDGAPCLSVDPDAMFANDPGTVAVIKAMCATCPVRAECLSAAFANHEEYGIWAGLTAIERSVLFKIRTEEDGGKTSVSRPESRLFESAALRDVDSDDEWGVSILDEETFDPYEFLEGTR